MSVELAFAPQKLIDDLQQRKAQAVQNSDYELAKGLRLTTDRLKVMQQAIEHTSNCKKAALVSENYDLAQALLLDLTLLNQTFHKIYSSAFPNSPVFSAGNATITDDTFRASKRAGYKASAPSEPGTSVRYASLADLSTATPGGAAGPSSGRGFRRESANRKDKDGSPVQGEVHVGGTGKRSAAQVEGSAGTSSAINGNNGCNKRIKNGTSECNNGGTSTPAPSRTGIVRNGANPRQEKESTLSPKEAPSLNVFKVPEFHIHAAPLDDTDGTKWLGCFLTDNPDKFLAAYPQLLRLPYSDRINVVACAQMLYTKEHAWHYPNDPRSTTDLRILPKSRKSAAHIGLDWPELVLLGGGVCWVPPFPRGIKGKGENVASQSKHENYIIQIPQHMEDGTLLGNVFKFYPPVELNEAGDRMHVWLPVVKDSTNNTITRRYVYITITVKLYKDNQEGSWSTTFWANAPRYIAQALELLFPNGSSSKKKGGAAKSCTRQADTQDTVVESKNHLQDIRLKIGQVDQKGVRSQGKQVTSMGRQADDEWGGGPPGGLAVRTVRPATHLLS